MEVSTVGEWSLVKANLARSSGKAALDSISFLVLPYPCPCLGM